MSGQIENEFITIVRIFKLNVLQPVILKRYKHESTKIGYFH